jgi:hypothetical protein
MGEVNGMKHSELPDPHRLADALGDVRAEIQALKAREATLRQALIEARPNGPITGERYEVIVRENQRRVFDRDSLPKAILGDHRFWMTRVSKTVVTRPRDAVRASAPAVGRTSCEPTLDLWGHDTELVLIEDF